MFIPNTEYLVVDDFATMRKVVKKVLIELGYSDISEAEGGQQYAKYDRPAPQWTKLGYSIFS